MNIVFIGFMACGKTTIGRRLAARLGYCFLDTDQQIERERQEKISSIFAEHGEAYFRQLETGMLKRLQGIHNTVIATGGGIITTPGNLELIKQIGRSVYLNVEIDEIYERVMRNDRRPLVRTADPYKTITELFAQRKTLYEQADLIITTSDLRRNQVVSRVIRDI